MDEVIARDQVTGPGDEPTYTIPPQAADRQAVAARHWFSTATLAMADEATARRQVVVVLPGRYTTCGD